MSEQRPITGQLLCPLASLPDGDSRGMLREGADDRLCVIRQGDQVFVWLNECPHEHRPMEYRQDRFLSGDGQHIVCYAHSAHFDMRTGECFAGPCVGQYLTKVPARVEDGNVWIPAELPSAFD
ncbi:Rieske (2Fe-2S) protein [Burkholderia gladioli]|jgi:nitrite reductase/ring-hydroxylating ferredoxin subunit|uniref:Rieske (2Fe-2S) protein n=1 Tax=Burkholderia gladioli TaxID=28095 RepID=UPI000F8010E9|nr:Rieske (2Fe-2S) protein [Burkholderia gladioli]MBU9641152.1 Rieske (2Fe-2S) protein [Burkholderia gladioli]MDN7807382.1 Rieske (2Fe-2S) protein [Burkholderia gladioli]